MLWWPISPDQDIAYGGSFPRNEPATVSPCLGPNVWQSILMGVTCGAERRKGLPLPFFSSLTTAPPTILASNVVGTPVQIALVR